MTYWDRIERLLGKSTLDQLANQTIGIVGLGSGGGFVALSLAMSGVGGFVLIDDDVLSEHNIVRHVCDLRDVGRPKVDAVADLILQRNPKARIKAIQKRVEDCLEELDALDLIVAGVDGEQPKYVINRLAMEHHVAVIYAGVYEKGEGGDVVVIQPTPGDGPCYACWANVLREGLTEVPDGGELDYGMIGPDGTLEAEPGLWLHVVRVAASQADLALNELLLGTEQYFPPPGNTVILANREMEIFEGRKALPYSAEWLTIDRDPDCLECGELARLADTSAGDLSLDALMDDSGIVFEAEDEDEREF